jgi:hypothetical protein
MVDVDFNAWCEFPHIESRDACPPGSTRPCDEIDTLIAHARPDLGIEGPHPRCPYLVEAAK